MALDISFLVPVILQLSLQATLAVTTFFGAWVVLLEASRNW